MLAMTKAERIAAALARQPVDRPPVAFWRHVPDVDHTAHGLADATLAFHRRWDLDLITVTPSAVYCVEDWGCEVEYLGAISGAKECRRHAVQTPGDWDRIGARDVGTGALGRELEAVRLTVAGRADDAPVLHTLFSPLTIALKLGGDRLLRDLRETPYAAVAALEAITATMVRYAEASLAAGADGIFFVTQVASAEVLTREEHARFEAPRVRRILEAIAERSRLTMLHVHGDNPYLDVCATMPVHALSWHDRTTPISLGAARSRFTLALAGGLDHDRTLRKESPVAIAAETRDAIAQAGGIGVIVAPGCVLPLDVPDASLAAVVEALQ